MIQDARARRDPVRAHEVFPPDRKRPDGQLQHAAADAPPGAHQGRQASGGTHGLTASGVALDGHADANDARLSGRIVPRKRPYVVRRNAGDRGHPFGRIGLDVVAQLVEADGVLFHVIAIEQFLGDNDVHHAESERGVGAGTDRDMPVGLARGAAPDRVDDDQLSALPLGFGNERPVMQVGADRVAGPENDVFGILEALRVHARRGTDGHEIGGARAGVAEGPLADGRAELVEERITDIQAVENAFGAEIAVRQDGGGAELIDDPRPAAPDFVQCRIPGDALEFSASFRPRSLQRIEHPVGTVDPVLVVVDLQAQPAARERVVGIAAHGDRPPILDGHQHCACVGAIVGACAADNAGAVAVCRHGHLRTWDMHATRQRNPHAMFPGRRAIELSAPSDAADFVRWTEQQAQAWPAVRQPP